jgi:hypothetical protein
VSGFSNKTGSPDLTGPGSTLAGTANVEQIVRLNSLDQMSPPAADLFMNNRRLVNIASPAFTTDAGTAYGQLLAATYYEPTSLYAKTIASTTGAAIDTTNLTVGPFTAISTAVLVELSAVGTIFAGTGSYMWGLFNHTGGAQVGYWAQAAASPPTGQTISTVRISIRVTGLTVGTSYQYDWAHVTSVGTATGLLASQCNTGVGTASEYGPAIMRVSAT